MEFEHASGEQQVKIDIWHIFQTYIGKCRKISFDVGSIRKINRVYEEYGIPTNEQILAFAKSNLILAPLTLAGVVFTEKAVYFTPRHEKEDGTKLGRIPYASIGSYLLFQEGPKGDACAMSVDGDIRMLSGTLFAQNIAGYEVMSILQSIQREIILSDAGARSSFNHLAAVYLEKTKAEMNIEEISERDNALLNMLLCFSEHADKAALIKAEALYRMFDPEKYTSFVSALPNAVSDETKALLKSTPPCFEENLISLLKNLDCELKYKPLSVLQKKIPEDNPLVAYVYIRMNEYELSSECIAYLRKVHGQAIADELEWFRCLHNARVMYRIYKAIKNHEEFPSGCTKYRDAVGLTPLHYAIILKDEQAIKLLLDKKKMWNEPCPFSDKFPFPDIYDYCVPAVAGKEIKVSDLLVGTNESIAELNNIIKSTRVKVGIKSAATRVQQYAYRTVKNEYSHIKLTDASFDKVYTMERKVAEMKEKLSDASDDVQQLRLALAECEDAMISMKRELVHNASITLRKASVEKNAIVKYLHRMFTDLDFFMKVMEAMGNQENLHLYRYKDIYFAAPDLAELNLTYYK